MIKKLFIIRKYVMANNAKQALSLEKNIKADDCWVDDEWKKNNMFVPPPIRKIRI